MRRATTALFILLMLVSPSLAAAVVVPGLPPAITQGTFNKIPILWLDFDDTSQLNYIIDKIVGMNFSVINDADEGGGIQNASYDTGRYGNSLFEDFDADKYFLVNETAYDVWNDSGLLPTTELTIAFWIKANPGSGTTIINKRDNNGPTSGSTGWRSWTVGLSSTNGYIYFHVTEDLGNDTAKVFTVGSAGPVADGNWHFVVCVYDGNAREMRIYIDGSLRNWVSTQSGKIWYDLDWLDKRLFIYDFDGVRVTGAGQIWLDDLQVYNSALSSQESQLLYQLGRSFKFIDVSLNLRQLHIPRLNLSEESATIEVSFDISADATGTVWIPVPASAKILDNVEFAYGIDGKVLTIDDNRYVNASSVTVSVPISIDTATESELPNELYLDSDSKTFEFKRSIRIYNPSDIGIMVTLSVDPRSIGVAQAYLDGSPMSLFNGSLVSSIILNPGESKVLELSATLPVTMRSLEFGASLDDFFEIDSFDEAVRIARSAAEGKIETVTKVIAIDSADFKSFGNRTVIIPLDVKASDVIEAKALTGSKELLEVREGKDGKAEIVVPATVFEGTPLNTQHAEIKVIYNKKPAWWERIPFLKSLGGFFEHLAKLFGFGR